MNAPNPDRMSRVELRAGASLASLFGLRMLGLFLILPVFAVYAPQLHGGDDLLLVGLALGAYGLTQAFFQLPFGMLSDRIGRKPVIAAGLLLFAFGSVVAAEATDIWIAILGRSLQGAGAISSVVVALAADLTRAQHRTKTMAMVGATIGLMFALSLVAAPALYQWIGMRGLFLMTGVLALGGIAVLVWVVPSVAPVMRSDQAVRPRLVDVLADRELARLNFGIFALHLVQMAMFVVFPTALVATGLALPEHWRVYLPVVLLSFVLMVPPIMLADRRGIQRRVMTFAVLGLLLVQLALVFAQSLYLLGVCLLVFFCAFNVLEAMLPSLVSRIAPTAARGTAIGVYNTTQTLGLFAGGLAGGWLARQFGAASVYVLGAALMVIWLALLIGMRPVNPASEAAFSTPASPG